jgi:arylsulfatase A-like enzyme
VIRPLLVAASLLISINGFASQPNVLFIAIDDLNDWIGWMEGHPQTKTPNIDRLAERGTLFTNAHCQAPICGPSRGSFLSGRYTHETGLYNQPSGNSLADDATHFDNQLLPQYFAANGYSTFGVGKITHGYRIEDTFQAHGPEGSSGPKPTDPKLQTTFASSTGRTTNFPSPAPKPIGELFQTAKTKCPTFKLPIGLSRKSKKTR